jgi:hypothetical protein
MAPPSAAAITTGLAELCQGLATNIAQASARAYDRRRKESNRSIVTALSASALSTRKRRAPGAASLPIG